jgi:hypothetical protein
MISFLQVRRTLYPFKHMGCLDGSSHVWPMCHLSQSALP